MYVYATDKCKKNAGAHGIQSEINKLCEEPNALARFSPIHPYWKRNIGNLRLLAKIEKVDNDQVLCLLDILKRGSPEYDNDFLHKRQEFGEQYLDPLLNPEQLRQWLNQQKESGDKQQKQLSPLPPELRHWLQPPSWRMDATELVIYESEQWLRKFGQEKFKDRRETYYQIICNIIDQKEAVGESTAWNHVNLSSNHDGHSVLFSRIDTIATEDTPARQVLFLLVPFADKPSPADIAEVVQATNLFDTDKDGNSFSGKLELDDLARIARRSYPDYLVADIDCWLSIEKEDEANLALSGEEELILESVSTGGKRSLPMFINGRAGSGKSTMLFHLFAEYCERHYNSCQDHGKEFDEKPHPLFLTYSEGLVKVAKEAVQNLWENHAKYKASRTENEAMPDIAHFFLPFQKFLLDLLPATERERFSPDKYISFNQFRKHYKDSKLPEAKNKNYSPARCWHIIRTFIKGYSLEGYMDPETYQEVPRGERTISDETFRNISQAIWDRWYKRLTERDGYWDDQDLIRKVLELKCYLPEYTAIFCDESQDFTRLELRLIMQLSVFSQYDLGYERAISLPFAFAGDPFQTLNPTGFRWDSVGASFYNEVIMTLDPANQLNMGMNFKDLKVNYRSRLSIVEFTNSIQLWRRVLFNLTELQLQKPWEKSSLSKPQKFIFGQNISASDLKRHIDKKPIFIVPCEAGGEISYIQNDEVLRELFSQVTEENPPENVYSAIKAKGLEFPLVILYKFGDEFAQQFDGKALCDVGSKSQDDAVDIQYFFNKLYVAASRAMSELFVIDSEEGDQLLWKFASEGELEQWLQQVKDCADWKDFVGNISEGESLEELGKDNRESQAQRLKKQGEREESSDLLRAAKQYYRDLGNTAEADICEALALKFENQFMDAGELFLKRGKKDPAWECFWKGACWQQLQEWLDANQGKTVERSVIGFMVPSSKTIADITEFTEFLEKQSIESKRLKNNRLLKPWQEAVKEYANQIEKLLCEYNLDPEQCRQFGNMLHDLDESGYSGTVYVAGSCFYHAKDYRNAVRCWETCHATEKREYNLAKAEVEGFPEGLQYLDNAEQHNRIVQEWEKQGKLPNAGWLKYVETALEKLEQYSSLVNYLISRKSWPKAIDAISRCPNPEEQAQLRIHLVREIAYSDLTDSVARDDRQRYVKLIAQVRGVSDWQQHLTVQEVGSALERIGELVKTLEFYEEFVDDANSKVRQFARERWIATKTKQKNYEGQTDGGKLGIIQQKLETNAHKWGIKIDSVSLEPPLGPSSRTTRLDEPLPPPVPTAEQSNQVAKGWPDWVKVEQLSDEIEKIQLGRLEVMKIKMMTGVTITIRETRTSHKLEVTVGSEGCKVSVDGKAEVEVSSRNQLIFKLAEKGYTGEVSYGVAQPMLVLKMQDPSAKIPIEL